ncbi:Dcp1-like decapping family protein [Xylariales sp. AK1849]|nr:Dcp1-like decapping family protein [Xylariales sp. AK1849]
MSSSTPRKRRNYQRDPSFHSHPHQSTSQHGQSHGHQRTRSQHLAAQAAASANQVTSDYESDTASYMASHPPAPQAALATRTNTDLNMSVLKRYLPNIIEIRSIAANAVVYRLEASDPKAVTWDKANIEGTMFVCLLDGGKDGKKNCVFILNRKAVDNLTIDLADVSEIELKDELLMFVMETQGEEEGVASKVLGFYIHADQDSTRATNSDLIQELWKKKREEKITHPAHYGQMHLQGGGAGLTMPVTGGRQVSLNELFGR